MAEPDRRATGAPTTAAAFPASDSAGSESPAPPKSPQAERLWESAALTDVGKVRDHNEDFHVVRPDLGLFMVCDGMGGHSAGEVASQLAAEVTSAFFERCDRDPEGTWPFRVDQKLGEEGSRLSVALRYANDKIREMARADSKKGNMGTTAVAAFLRGERSWIAHAGDSRAYLFRDGRIWPVTADHSLLGDFIRSKRPTAQEIQAFPYKNVISRALGPAADVKIDSSLIDMLPGDVLLLCCDGLHGLVSDDQMARLLTETEDLEQACRKLFDAANDAGGVDNVTVVLVRRRLPARP